MTTLTIKELKNTFTIHFSVEAIAKNAKKVLKDNSKKIAKTDFRCKETWKQLLEVFNLLATPVIESPTTEVKELDFATRLANRRKESEERLAIIEQESAERLAIKLAEIDVRHKKELEEKLTEMDRIADIVSSLTSEAIRQAEGDDEAQEKIFTTIAGGGKKSERATNHLTVVR